MRKTLLLTGAVLALAAMGQTPVGYTPTGLTACAALERLPIAEITGIAPVAYGDPTDMTVPADAPTTLSFCAATDAKDMQIVTLLLREAKGGDPVGDVPAHVAERIDEMLAAFSDDPAAVPRVDLGDGGYYAQEIGQLGVYANGAKVLAIFSGKADHDGLEALAAAFLDVLAQAGG